MGIFSRFIPRSHQHDELDKAIVRAIVAVSHFDMTMGQVARSGVFSDEDEYVSAIDTTFESLVTALATKGDINEEISIEDLVNSKIKRLHSIPDYTVNDTVAFPWFAISVAVDEARKAQSKKEVSDCIWKAGIAYLNVVESFGEIQNADELCTKNHDKYTMISKLIDDAQ